MPDDNPINQQGDIRVDWKRRYDEMSARETPDHPDCKGGEPEHLNGPKVKSQYARGSVEWQREQARQRSG